jgi:hypothetical protein
VQNGALKLRFQPGKPLQVLASDNTMLGSYRPLLQQLADSKTFWTGADAIVAVRKISNSAHKAEFEIDFQNSSGPLFEVTVHITVEAGKPYFFARAVAVKSLAPSNWTLASLYHYVPSSIGGDVKDDVLGGPDAPNYWMPAGAWSDPSGWSIGLFAPREDERLSINFWRDEAGNQHPDARRVLEGAGVQMKPEQVWKAPADEPRVAVFGLKSSAQNPRPWGDLAMAMRMASQK